MGSTGDWLLEGPSPGIRLVPVSFCMPLDVSQVCPDITLAELAEGLPRGCAALGQPSLAFWEVLPLPSVVDAKLGLDFGHGGVSVSRRQAAPPSDKSKSPRPAAADGVSVSLIRFRFRSLCLV